LKAAASLVAAALALCACRAGAPAPEAPPSAPAAPAAQAALPDLLPAASREALAGRIELAFDARATVQLQIENRLTRVSGRVELVALDGRLLGARVDAAIDQPAPAPAARVELHLRDGRWLALDHAARSFCASEDPAALAGRAQLAAALLPADLVDPSRWIPAGATARAGETTDFGGLDCASLEWTAQASRGEWLIGPDGLPRLRASTVETPGRESEVRRLVLQRLERRAFTPRAPVPPSGWSELAPVPPAAPTGPTRPIEVRSLAASVEPLRAAFEAGAGKPRVIGTFAPS
jgi:hypothetical protein